MPSTDLRSNSPSGVLENLENDTTEDEWNGATDEEMNGALGDNTEKKTYSEIKEQMYHDKLSELKRQLAELSDGVHPEWSKKLKRLEFAYKERLRINTIIRDLEVEIIEQDFINEKKSALREFEDQKIYLRDNLISELEEKQKMIEAERYSLELSGDAFEVKPVLTRKLRRRANDPSGSSGFGHGDRRRKPTQLSNMNYLLREADINDDLKFINKNKAVTQPPRTTSSVGSSASSARSSSPSISSERDIRFENGKLFYDRRWFRRGQAVQVEGRSGGKFAAMISAIATEAVWVRKTSDNSKLKIHFSQLSKGKYILKRRAF